MFKFFTVFIIIHKARILPIRMDILTSRNATDFFNAKDKDFLLAVGKYSYWLVIPKQFTLDYI